MRPWIYRWFSSSFLSHFVIHNLETFNLISRATTSKQKIVIQYNFNLCITIVDIGVNAVQCKTCKQSGDDRHLIKRRD